MSETPQAAAAAPVPEPAGRRRRIVSLAGQAAGVAGIAISLLLIVLVIVGRGWFVGTVSDVEASINAAVGRATPIVATAQGTVDDVGQKMADLATAADAVAATDRATPEALVPLQERLSAVADRYLGLRQSYGDLRTNVSSAVDRLELLARVVPGVSIPQGPRDALTAFDEKAQALDARVMGVIQAGAANTAANAAATAIAARAREVEATLGDVSAGLDAIDARLANLQAQVTSTASTVETLSTVVTVIVILLLLYLVFLHVVLFRTSRQYGRAAAA